MKSQLHLLQAIAILVFSTAIIAQQPTGTPPTQPDEPIVKINTTLIQIDVTVTDKQGKIISDLKPEDFEVLENGERQTISNFNFVNKSAGGAVITLADAQNAGRQDASNALTRPQIRRTFAIVIDDLNLSFESVYYTRKALKRFVDVQMTPGDLVAIIRTGGGVGALQQFTSDKKLLYAAIDKIRWNPFGSAAMTAIRPLESSPQDITERTANDLNSMSSITGDVSGRILGKTRPNITQDKASSYDQLKNQMEAEEAVNTNASLQAVKYIISGMKALPGRKALMLFSDGIRISSTSNKSSADSVRDYLLELIDFANRSSVVVYTFDTRGLQSLGLQAQDTNNEFHSAKMTQKLAERFDNFNDAQDGLAVFANGTGGKSLLNSNDLNYGIQRVLDEQAGYYLLGYLPDGDTFDVQKRRFNKLEVKVKRPNVKVSYRSGFFNSVADGNSPGPGALDVTRQIANALMSPFVSSDIALNLNALYADDAKEGAYIRSFLHIDVNGLTFTTDEEGWKHAAFDAMAVTFGSNGVPVEQIETKYTIKTKGITYETMLKQGLVYVLIMPIKKPGAYQYRIALRDAASGKIGSAYQQVDVPKLSDQNLTVSSLAVENVSLATWEALTQGKTRTGSAQTQQVASTLMFDTVFGEFRAGTVLRYGFEVYNTKPDKAGLPHIETQARILQTDKVIVAGNLNKPDLKNEADMRHIRLSGAMMLKPDLPDGDYVLQVVVKDSVANRVTFGIFPFKIVK